jgi:hypothetical protein
MNFKKYSALLCLLFALKAQGAAEKPLAAYKVFDEDDSLMILNLDGCRVFGSLSLQDRKLFLRNNPDLLPFAKSRPEFYSSRALTASQSHRASQHAARLASVGRTWQETLDSMSAEDVAPAKQESPVLAPKSNRALNENFLQPGDIVKEQFTPEAIQRFAVMSLSERKQSLLRLQPLSWPLAIAQARKGGPDAVPFADTLKRMGFGF